jgi:hypothetical protein
MSQAATAWAELAGILTPPGITAHETMDGRKSSKQVQNIFALYFALSVLWKQWKTRQNEAQSGASGSFFHSRLVEALIGPRQAGIFALAGRKHPFAGRLEALEPRPMPQR